MLYNLLTISRPPSDYGMIVGPFPTDYLREILSSLGQSLLVPSVVSILTIICLWRIFRKAGGQGWPAIIPLYKTYSLYKISWGNGWFFLFEYGPCIPVFILAFLYFQYNTGGATGEFMPVPALILVLILALVLSVAALAISVITYYKLSKAFGQSGWFTLGLLFLNPLFLAILAFGPARYIGIAIDATVEDLPYVDSF